MPLVIFALFVGGLVLLNRRHTTPPKRQLGYSPVQVISVDDYVDADRVPGQTVAAPYPGEWVVVKRTGLNWGVIIHTPSESDARKAYNAIDLLDGVYIAMYDPSGRLVQALRVNYQ